MSVPVPTPEQQDVLDIGLDSIRIRAGAGTGKTTTVAMAIANLVEKHGVEPERILGITFTNKAASELADRVRAMLGSAVDEGRQVEVHTYHGFAAQVLAEFGALVGVDTRVRVITPTFSRQLLAEIVYNTGYRYLDITNPRPIDKVRVLGDRLADHLVNPEDLMADAELDDEVWAQRAELVETLSHYRTEKKRLGVVDYGDLITLSAQLMTDHPELAGTIRARYQAAVLDEYQDTNPAQRVLLNTIFDDQFPVVAVGDEDQTIYEWRGATPENFELFPEHFRTRSGDEAHRKGLTLNRRSAQIILDVANLIRKKGNPEADELTAFDPEKKGQVVTHWAADAIAEADWIAEQFGRFHDDGLDWSDMAVLFRKNKDFAVVVDAMRTADIPVEVANLGGLLSVPEVAEVRAWLTILEHPAHSSALTQILFGSRYRLGLADVAPLTKWVGGAQTDDDSEDVPAVSILEAIENLDGVSGLRPEARQALSHFLGCYKEILTESQGANLVETCRLILDRTRAWQDIESLPATQRLTARLNLYRLLDLAEDWSPLIGRTSLHAFLDYLEAMEGEPAEELDVAHLSGENAVTLVTVHRAKGLEWEVVAIPAVVEQNFPGKSSQHPDPIRFAEYLPPDHRIDNALVDMPADEKDRKEFFKEQNTRQEWRVAYVATTRAKSKLLVSGADWYGLPEPNKRRKKPSELFELVAAQPGVEDGGHAAETPRPEILRRESGETTPDPLFREGWEDALRRVAANGQAMHSLARELGLNEELDRKVEDLAKTLFTLEESQQPEPQEPDRVVSVTGLVTYAGCPKRYYWSDVDPLPRRRNPAAVAGTELHRRIELHHRGQVPFEEFEPDLYDAPDESTGPGGFTTFKESRFATESPALIEAPFILKLDSGYRVRGRIDAIYVKDDEWEVVDFKSGRPSGDDARIVQLEAYALAAQQADLGIPKPASTRVTFAYLGGGLTEESHQADEGWLANADEHLNALTNSIDATEFEERPGDRCGSCDFLRFCEPGQQWMSDS